MNRARILFVLPALASLGLSGGIAEGQGMVPATPTHFGANFSQDCPQVLLQWHASEGATSYQLFQEQAILWSNPGGLVYMGTAVSTDVSVTSGLNYLWKVQACNANGCSPLSGVASGEQTGCD